MRYKPEQKEKTRERIVAAAGRSFKKGGYSGVGVDGLAKEAGVTSGAFYGHFPSKKDAFKEAIILGMSELQTAISDMQQSYGDEWWKEFATFYTSQKLSCDLKESCALQSLTPEVGRSDEDVQGDFETQLLEIIKLVSNNKAERNLAWASLSMLVGGVTLARAVKDEKLSKEIATAIKNEVIVMHKLNSESS